MSTATFTTATAEMATLEATQPVLCTGFGKLKQIDTTDPREMTQVWRVFEQAAAQMEAGERAKNMAFRMVQHQVLRRRSTENVIPEGRLARQDGQACGERPASASSSSLSTDSSSTQQLYRSGSSSSSVPSASPHDEKHDSAATGPSAEGGDGHATTSVTCDIPNTDPQSRSHSRIPATDSSRSLPLSFRNEQSAIPAISAVKVEQIMSTVHQPKLDPLTPPRSLPAIDPSIAATVSATASSTTVNPVVPVRLTPPPDQSPERRSSGGNISTSTGSTHSIIRGFSSKLISRSSASRLVMAADSKPATSSKPLPLPNPKPRNMFSIGVGGSSNDDDSPMDSVAQLQASAADKSKKHTKHASFSDQVAIQQSAPSDSDFTTDISDSAIEDDDDDAEWEDESGQASPQPKLPEPVTFQRTQSTTQLRPNRSALSLMFKQQPTEESEASEIIARMQTSGARRYPRTSNGPSLGNSFDGKPNLLRMATASRARLGPQGPSGLPCNPSAPHLAAMGQHGARATTSSVAQPICIASEAKKVKAKMVQSEMSSSLAKGVWAERNIKGREMKAAEALKRSATTNGELSSLARTRQLGVNGTIPEETQDGLERDFSDAELNRYFDPKGLSYNECGW